MLFKDIKQGYPIFILNRKEVTVSTGKVTNSPMPHFDTNFPGSAKMVVDINVSLADSQCTYVLEDSLEVGYVGNLVISCNRDSIVREVESLKAQSEEALNMTDWHKSSVEKCTSILQELSPEFKQRTETSSRFQTLENKVDLLSDALTQLINKFEKGGVR